MAPGREQCTAIERDLCDLSDEELLELCTGVDVVFHLAAEKYNSSRSTPQRLLATNVLATERLFTAAGRAKAGKVVFTSSLYAYGSVGPQTMRETDLPEPTTLYGVSKVAGEHMLRVVRRDHGLSGVAAAPVLRVRPAPVCRRRIQVRDHLQFLERIRRGERPTIRGDGKQALDYVYIDDITTGLLASRVPDVADEVVNLASGDAISINVLTAMMLEVSESSLEPEFVPADWTAGSRRCGDPGRASLVLAWKPTVTAQEGLSKVWAWMKDGTDG